MSEGIVVASDLTQEWLLPWWWEHYQKHNTHPVCFIDLGMSHEMKEWCRQKGKWIPLVDIKPFFDEIEEDFNFSIAQKEDLPSSLAQEWENVFDSQVWAYRNVWFKKPLACLLSPYSKSIWIDLDCEIRGSIASLFPLCENPSEISAAKVFFHFNSGVFVFKKEAPIIRDWAIQSIQNNHLFSGDEEVLSSIIENKKLPIQELPLIYNWSRLYPDNPDAVILHWHGKYGKAVINHQIT